MFIISFMPCERMEHNPSMVRTRVMRVAHPRTVAPAPLTLTQCKRLFREAIELAHTLQMPGGQGVCVAAHWNNKDGRAPNGMKSTRFSWFVWPGENTKEHEGRYV